MKKSVLLLISWIFVGFYIIANGIEYFNYLGSDDVLKQASALIAGFLIGPHFLLVSIGLVFNVLAYFQNTKSFMLTSGILYSVAGVIFIPAIFYVLLPSVLCYVAFGMYRENQVNDLSIYQSKHYRRDIEKSNFDEAKEYFRVQNTQRNYRSRSARGISFSNTMLIMFRFVQYLIGLLIILTSMQLSIPPSKVLLGILIGIFMLPIVYDAIARYRYIDRRDFLIYEISYFFIGFIVFTLLFV